jgi:hypothetical protein
MDVLTDMRFWGEVGLAAASRLALLAAVIWVARLVMAPRAARLSAPARERAISPARPVVAAAVQTVSAARYVDLKSRPRPAPAPSNAAAAPSALRERLSEYLKQPVAGRAGA